MATISGLVNRVRVELGDIGKSFVQQFMADGTTNRFRLKYSPLDATTVEVFRNGIDITNTCTVEESSGVIILETVPLEGDEMTVSGTYYRYFTGAELATLVGDAVAQHSAGQVDSLGRKITVETLPLVDEYPTAIYAVTLALFTLATDASFDIDISAPDGVNIPRSERYRQLMDMVNARQAQYRDLCVQLGLGMYKIEVFTTRRISKATGRYVPVYKPQEVDDRSYPQRVNSQLPTYGDKPVAWPTDAGELVAYQGRAFTADVNFEGTFDVSTSFAAKVLSQRGSVLVAENFDLSVVDNGDGTFVATLSLTPDQTMKLARRTYWSLQLVDPDKTDPNTGTILPAEIKGGQFFVQRVSEVII